MHLVAFKCERQDDDSETDPGWEGADDWEECVKAFQYRLARFSKEDSTRETPEIFLHEWRRLQARTEEENREDGVVSYVLAEEDAPNVDRDERDPFALEDGDPDPFGERDAGIESSESSNSDIVKNTEEDEEEEEEENEGGEHIVGWISLIGASESS